MEQKKADVLAQGKIIEQYQIHAITLNPEIYY